jgi:lantibiotic modifying enzyme
MNGCEALRESELAQLVAQASTLYERLGPEWQPDEARWEAGQARARLATWLRLVATGNLSQFEQRLARDGLDTRQALLRLGAARPSTGILPKWVETLQQALLSANAVRDQPPPVSDRCLDPEHPVPFQDVLLSFVRIARQRLLAQPDLHYDRLPQVCQAALEHALVRVLSMTGAQTLLLKFAVFRATRSLGDQSVLPDDTGRRYYSAFVSDLLNGGLRQVLQEYSVLARLLTMQTDQWIEATGEFLRRLQTDWPRLTSFQTSILGHRQEAQSVSDPFECLIGLKSSLSDSHHGGRSVIALEFASGVKLVYKPRDLGIEVAFQHLVVWLNDRGLTPRLMPLVVLNCGTHGWVEFVEHRPCNNRNEAMRYYERAGALLALMYVLGGTDCHYENLVASGPQPVLIEHEMLMCPDSMAQADGIDREVTRPQARSVLDWEIQADWSSLPAI